MRATHNVVVAIPARDEEVLLGGCLTSVLAATRTLRRLRPEIQTRIVVALDGCTDGSARVVEATGAQMVILNGHGVGATRDAAVVHGLTALHSPAESHTWLACTDADTVVPSTWLSRQLIWADRGMDLVIGTVEPTEVVDPAVLAAWHGRHRLAEGHPHVHGANLGVRASAWRAVGGFGLRTAHEDVALVARVQSGSERWVATDTTRVRTSGRLSGRVERGFAGYLNSLSTRS